MHRNYSCIIIDDEPDAIELLADRITHLHKNIQITNTFLHWEEALEALQKNHCDVLFMDVSMPEKNAIDLLKLLPDLQSEIIFVTAYEQYALAAFNFSASGYILKPIDDRALTAAVNKALERVQNKRVAKQHITLTQVNDKMRIPNNHGIDYVNLCDIMYVETINKCTRIVTAAAEYISSYQLGRFKEQLTSPPFFQVHRSYIININFINRYETSGLVVMGNKREIPVARSMKNDFLRLFNNEK